MTAMAQQTAQQATGVSVKDLTNKERADYGKTINEYLKRSGSSVTVDPNDTKSLERGIKIFQATNQVNGGDKLDVTGKLDIKTVRALGASDQVQQNQGSIGSLVLDGVTETAAKVGNAIAAKANNAIDSTVKEVKAQYNNGIKTVKGYGTDISNGIDRASDVAVAVGNGIGAAGKDAFDWTNANVVLPAKKMASTAVDKTVATAKATVNAIDKNVVDPLADAAVATKDGVVYAAKATANGVSTAAKASVGAVVATGKAIDDKVIDPAADAGVAAWNAVGTALDKGVEEYQRTRAEQTGTK